MKQAQKKKTHRTTSKNTKQRSQPLKARKPMMKSVPKEGTKSHYIDNKRFLDELVTHRKAVAKARKAGNPLPQASDYIGQCFLDIANNLAKKANFANYSYRDEMVSDSVENCIMYVTNFDPRKSKNPFAFFTQIVYYAFLRRISKEKKQNYVKMKCFEQKDPTGKFRNWMEKEHLKYADAGRSPYLDFILQAEPSVADRAKRRRGRKPLLGTTLDEVME